MTNKQIEESVVDAHVRITKIRNDTLVIGFKTGIEIRPLLRAIAEVEEEVKRDLKRVFPHFITK
jgi:hypothetical protein